MKNLSKYPFCTLLIIFSISFQLHGQEICNNGIDDDSDGFIDCLDIDCDDFENCEEVIPCSNSLYQVISGDLKIFDPLTSSYEDIGSSGIG